MVTVDVVAIALGVVVACGMAYLTSARFDPKDADMLWEGRVAGGFGALIVVGPVWIGQVVATIVASVSDGGIWAGWLWVWLLAASALGTTPPAKTVARLVLRALSDRTAGPNLDQNAAAVQQAAHVAWADTRAEAHWELRRTPPLPAFWPPPPGGPTVWLCYAERAVTSDSIEVSAPWARITLNADPAAQPAVQRLSNVVTAIGTQSVPMPESPSRRPSQAALLDAVRRGDPKGLLAKTLAGWRLRNECIAGNPAVVAYLPAA